MCLQHVALQRWLPVSLLRLVDERLLHLNNQLVEEEIGQLRVDRRLELEGDGKVDDAGLRDVLDARREAPVIQQVTEQPSVVTLGLD